MMGKSGNFTICPKCGSKNREIGITMQKIITIKDGHRSTYNAETDAGYTKCLDCGHKELN